MAYNLLASVVPADVKPNQPIWLNDRDYTMGFLRSETTAKHKVVIVSKAAVHDDVIKWKHFPRYWPFMRGTAEFPTQRPVTRSFDEFFYLRLNKRLSKQSWGWWFETPLCSLWRHCNDKLLCDLFPNTVYILFPNTVYTLYLSYRWPSAKLQ